jgi:hypothetical protein
MRRHAVNAAVWATQSVHNGLINDATNALAEANLQANQFQDDADTFGDATPKIQYDKGSCLGGRPVRQTTNSKCK